jgi:choline-sulfatase
MIEQCMPDERPNVLFLMTDEHRPDLAGFAGNDVVHTPNLDWLAETGTQFTNAYTPSPICVPGRHAIRTGKLPRTYENESLDEFDDEYPYLARQFTENAYMTVQAGKEHYPGWSQMLGYRKRLGPTPMKRAVGDTAVDTENSGALELEREVDYGDYGGWNDWKWFWGKEVKRAGISDSRVQVQDRRSVEGTEQFLRQFFVSPYYDRAQPDRPLFAKVSLIQPHYPFFTEEEELFTYYMNRVDPYVETPGEHPAARTDRWAEAGELLPGEDVTAREIRRATAAYYAMVERVDALFGQVIDQLRQVGEDPDEWMIVFTSDHGEMLGERGLWGKINFYEPAARVPLIIRWPERFDSGIVDQNVSLCDLYATLCELAEIPIPDDVDSRSLVPLLEDETNDWADEAISQGGDNTAVHGGLGPEELMIKQDDLKYCWYGEGEPEPEVLFDLDLDSGETTNYADDPEYSVELDRFRERRGELGYGPNADPDYENAGYH